jgi:tetratricopeptide (TPR) repeat protein
MKPLTPAQQRTAARAQQLRNAGNPSQALKLAEDLARQARGAPDALLLLAVCRAELRDFDGSERAFRGALELAPEHPLILVNFATMLKRAGRPADAMQAYERAIKRDPNLDAGWLGLARSACECGELTRADEAIGRFLERHPDSATGWYERGRIERAGEAYEKARDAFARASELDPKNGLYDASRAVAERLMGRPDAALASFEQARTKGLWNAEVENTRIGTLLDCGRIEQAYQQVESLLARHPDYAPAYETMADILWEYGGTLDMETDPSEVFRKAIDQVDNKREIRRAYAEFLLKARRNDEAIEVIETLRRDDDNPILMTLQANALENSRQFSESATLYRRAYQLLGDSRADFLCAYVRHLLRGGEWQEAAARASAAIKVAPDNQEAWAYLATAWRLLDDPHEYWLCDYENAITFIEVPPPRGYPDSDSYLRDLRLFLDSLHRATREPIQQSLRNGSQTAGRLFGRTEPVIGQTQQALTSAIEQWLSGLAQNEEHPFYRRNTGRIRYTGSWSVKLRASGRHVNHIHPQGWISSAYYVSLPESVRETPADSDDLSGCIQFGQPPDELGLDLPPRRIIRPREGFLALFPSYMWHGTVPFEDESPRMTIAFDMRARSD